jgi:hypothetical protein
MARESLEMADKNKEQCLEENCMPHATLKKRGLRLLPGLDSNLKPPCGVGLCFDLT